MQVTKKVYLELIEVAEQRAKRCDWDLIKNRNDIKRLAAEQKELKRKKHEAFDAVYLLKNGKPRNERH